MTTRLERVDLPFYREHIKDFLPRDVLDFHVHVGRPEHFARPYVPPRNWAEYVCPRAWTVEALFRYYARILPGTRVTPVLFGIVTGNPDVDALNEYVAASAVRVGACAFLVTRPEWKEEELAERARRGGFKGLKPYPTMAGAQKDEEPSIFSFLPHGHLAVAEDMGLCVLLHLPRAGRLADPHNIEELHRIVRQYPRLKLVVAHVGRAYCLPGAKRGLEQMRDCSSVYYDISASANDEVFELALREVGPHRLIFGTDLPAVAFRARRICEGDNYINIVPHAKFNDPHLRVAPPGERDKITFYIYEQVAALRRAAERVSLSRAEVEDIFRGNAERLLNA